jgi:hypothetical protein
MLTCFFKTFNRAVITLHAVKAHVYTIHNVITLLLYFSILLHQSIARSNATISVYI